MAATSELPDTSAETWQIKNIYHVEVEIIKGMKLIAGDRSGTSDPYVKVQCGKRIFKTDKIDKTLNPEWNAKTEMTLLKKPKEISFDVLDWNQLGKSDPLGEYKMDISEFFTRGHKGTFYQSLPIPNPQDNLSQTPKNEI